jgi:hypothetical protein
MYRLHLQGRKSAEQETSVQQVAKQNHSSDFRPWRWKSNVPLKLRWTYGLQGAISQKVADARLATISRPANVKIALITLRAHQQYIRGHNDSWAERLCECRPFRRKRYIPFVPDVAWWPTELALITADAGNTVRCSVHIPRTSVRILHSRVEAFHGKWLNFHRILFSGFQLYGRPICIHPACAHTEVQTVLNRLV